MGKTLTCPFCHYGNTIKVVYCYKGHKIRDKYQNKYKEDELMNLVRDGTIYRTERPRYVKYDFDGEKIKASLYNKFCPNCNTYFHSIGNMAVVDIVKIVFIYEINDNRYRYDFNFSDIENSRYSYKKNYVLIINDTTLSKDERFNILKSIKESKMKFWHKQYGNIEYSNYRWIIKIEYVNGLSDCFFGYDEVPDKWGVFISGFKDVICKYDNSGEVDKIK